MTALLEIISDQIAPALGLKSGRISVMLRSPLENQSNRLYDVWAGDRHWIAKEYIKPEELESAPRREHKTLCLLAPLDIAPQPVFYEPAVGPIVIYEYMEGQMWDRRHASPADLQKLAEVWLKLNAARADWASRGHERSLHIIEQELQQGIQNYLDWAKQMFEPATTAAEMCLEILASRHAVIQELSAYPSVPCFGRGDPRFANVIQRPNGQLGLVDWEDSGLRDPAKEAADIVSHPNQEDLLSWDEWQVFIAPYLAAHSKIDPRVGVRLQRYLAIFPIFWLMIIIRRGIQLASANRLAGWMSNGIPANLRLQRYLARALAWPKMDYKDTLETLREIEFFPEC